MYNLYCDPTNNHGAADQFNHRDAANEADRKPEQIGTSGQLPNQRYFLPTLSQCYKRRRDSGVSFLAQRSRFYVAPLHVVTGLPAAPRAKSSVLDQTGQLKNPRRKDLPK
ncbi:MAG: hypothetical protein H7X91_04485 [Burkholderiales bacterium]|nr:hypothetical protein [Burkholderiales bacterium]